MESAKNDEQAPTIHQLNGSSNLLPQVSVFANLSAGTEFGSYKEPQWRFLLGGNEMTAFVITPQSYSSSGIRKQIENDDNNTSPCCFDGCVLKVNIDNANTVGFGMVLVRPSKRGRGLARALIEKAMSMQIAQNGEEQQSRELRQEKKTKTRFILAICSSLGQPLYRKLGFVDAGTVTALTCSVSDLMQMIPCEKKRSFGNLVIKNGKECTEDQFTLLVNHDTYATGMNRRDRISLLLNGYAEGSRSTVAFLSSAQEGQLGASNDNCCSTAVARQDCANGPLFMGPMTGGEENYIPLMSALIDKHFKDNAEMRIGDVNDIRVMMMIPDHPELVTRLLEIQGMSKMWECPAMSSDGRSVYLNGDGSYLAMMHPTLG